MLLVVDVGNTSIALGLYRGETLTGRSSLPTKTLRTSDGYGAELLKFLGAESVGIESIEAVAVSSVVPGIMESFTDGVRRYLKKEPFLVGAECETGISVRTDRPGELGPDRLVDAAAAYKIYGGPILIIDFGTATTYDIVTGTGEFLGGVIAPGMEICAEALWEKTAMLPKIPIGKPDGIVGTNTAGSIRAGLFYGYIGQVEYIVRKIKEALGGDIKVVATGGLSGIFKGNTGAIDFYDGDLTFKGLRHIYAVSKGRPLKNTM
jgi:type III pantothenate kinase